MPFAARKKRTHFARFVHFNTEEVPTEPHPEAVAKAQLSLKNSDRMLKKIKQVEELHSPNKPHKVRLLTFSFVPCCSLLTLMIF